MIMPQEKTKSKDTPKKKETLWKAGVLPVASRSTCEGSEEAMEITV